MKKLLLIIALLPLMAFGQSGGNRQIKQVNSGLAGNGICVVIVDNNGQIQSIAKGVNGEVLSLDANDSLGFFPDIDPVYAADSAMIVFFADTVTKIATKADIQTIISVGAYILNNQSSAQKGNIWIGKTTDTAYKGLVIQNKKTLATNNENQIVLGNGSTLLGASDRTYYLTNKMTSATAAQFALKYWNGTATFTPFVVNSDQTVTFDSTITISNGILDTHAATVGQMRDSISDFINQPTATTADNRLLKTVGTSGRNLEQTGVSVNDDNSIVTSGYIQAGKDTVYVEGNPTYSEIINITDGNILKYANNSIALGVNAMNYSNAVCSNGFGNYALYNNQSSYSNGFGYYALYANTGDLCNGFGYKALYNNSGENANGIGEFTLAHNSGLYCNAFGGSALYENTGDLCNGFGYMALYNNTGENANGIGEFTLANNSGFYCNAFGGSALNENTGDLCNGFGYSVMINNIGNNSNGFGFATMASNKGNYCSGFGNQSLYGNAGDSVVGIGNNTLMYVKRTSYNLIGIGQGAAKGSIGDSINAVNAVAIGANSTINASNSINLGDGSVNKLYMANKEVFYQPLQYGTAGTSGQLLVASGANTSPVWTSKSSISLTAFDSTGFRVKPSQITGFYPGAGIPLSTGTGWGTSITNNSANWNTAYGWGNHASAGYLTSQTSHADVVVDGDFTSQGIMLRGASSGTYSILTNNSSNWNTAYGWGNHASAGYITESSSNTLTNKSGNISMWTNNSGYITSSSLLWETYFLGNYIVPKDNKNLKIKNSSPIISIENNFHVGKLELTVSNPSEGYIYSDYAGIKLLNNGKVAFIKEGTILYSFPSTDGTVSGQVLTTNGSGTLSWATVSTGGGDMYKSIYDTNSNNIVDNSAALGGVAASNYVTLTGSQTLTNKTLTTPKLSATASGTTAGNLGYSSGTLSFGDGSFQRTVVTTDNTQTLKNKTVNGVVLKTDQGASLYLDGSGNYSSPSGSGGGIEAFKTLTSSPSIAWNVNTSRNANLTISHNAILSMTNQENGEKCVLIVTPNTLVSYVLTFPAYYFANNHSNAFTIAAGSGTIYVFTITYNGSIRIVDYATYSN